MKWNRHICELVKRIRKCIYIFIRLRNILKLNNLKKVYYALVQSLIQYGIIGWGGAYEKIVSPVKVVQKLIIKVILKKQPTFPSATLFKIFKVPKIEDLYKKDSILQIFKENLIKKFKLNSSLRHKHNIQIPLFSTQQMHNNYIYKGIKYFNSLPEEIKKITDFVSFKKKIKLYCKNEQP